MAVCHHVAILLSSRQHCSVACHSAANLWTQYRMPRSTAQRHHKAEHKHSHTHTRTQSQRVRVDAFLHTHSSSIYLLSYRQQFMSTTCAYLCLHSKILRHSALACAGVCEIFKISFCISGTDKTRRLARYIGKNRKKKKWKIIKPIHIYYSHTQPCNAVRYTFAISRTNKFNTCLYACISCSECIRASTSTIRLKVTLEITATSCLTSERGRWRCSANARLQF